MVDPEKAAEIIEKHFASSTTEQFLINLEKYCPEVFEENKKNQI